LLYAGTIEPRKNVSGLLAAYARLPEAIRRRVPLLIAGGSGWGGETLGHLIDRHHVHREVRVLGYVDDDALAHLYAGAQALVWPTFYEGFGFPPLEAMASGTPVITSNVASLSEVAGDAAVLVDPHDENRLCQAMCRVLEDHVWAESLRARGLARSEQFCWSRCACEHGAVYRRLAAD
jgi:alpha-1,3-rhamnosyl/mannosyltransferase